MTEQKTSFTKRLILVLIPVVITVGTTLYIHNDNKKIAKEPSFGSSEKQNIDISNSNIIIGDSNKIEKTHQKKSSQINSTSPLKIENQGTIGTIIKNESGDIEINNNFNQQALKNNDK